MSAIPEPTLAEQVSAVLNGLFYNFSGVLERFGRDLFLVDGDALLAHVLEEVTAASDFQLLPVLFRVEHALSRLNQLGAQFRVFFLGAYAQLGWHGASKLCVCVHVRVCG